MTDLDQEVLEEVGAVIRSNGWDRHQVGDVLLEFASHLVLFCGGTAAWFAPLPAPLRVLGLVCVVAGYVGVSTNTHTATHGATTGGRRWNKGLSLFGSPFFAGVTLTYWRDKHVRRHHAHPNVAEIDPDHDFLPWFALTSGQLDDPRALPRAWYRLQPVVFPLALTAMLTNMRLTSVGHALREVRSGRRRSAALLDLGLFGASVAVFWGLPLALAPLPDALIFAAARGPLASLVLFCMFAPAHIPPESVYFTREGEPESLVERQARATVNFRAGRVAAHFLSGLQFQVEHHLFPGLPHTRYRDVSPLVRRALEARGLPHRTLGWGEAIGKSLRVAWVPKPEIGAVGDASREAS